MSFQVLLHENAFIDSQGQENLKSFVLVETDDYDRIFTALKHPIRRRILFLLEGNGEASFTEIQKAVRVDDTGLLSYHLKELAPLITQSTRGGYILSEVGQASMPLFRKVEREKHATIAIVQKHLERITGQVVLLFLIVAVTLVMPLSVGSYNSVQAAYSNLTTAQLIVLLLASLGAMTFGATIFIFYDRHYFSTRVKTNTAHCLLFAAGISLISTISAYSIHSFGTMTLGIAASTNVYSATFLVSLVRALCFLVCAPIVACAFSRFLNNRR